MILTQAQALEAIAAIRAANPAANLIKTRGRAIHAAILAYQRGNREAMRRICRYHDQTDSNSPEDYPALALFALERFDGAYLSAGGITILTSERAGDDRYHHSFEIPLSWLWQEHFGHDLAMQMDAEACLVDARDAQRAARDEETERAEYERLKERFGPTP